MNIDEFREQVASMRPQNFMALNGAASAIIGTSNTGADVTLQLQRAAIEFAKSYKSSADTTEVEATRQALEGLIMMSVTVDAISQKRADELSDNLQILMKERK